MNGQQIIALAIVAVAAVYLGRNLLQSWNAFRSGKGGCESGCGKCGFAPKNAPLGKPSVSSRPNVIPLAEITTLPRKRE